MSTTKSQEDGSTEPTHTPTPTPKPQEETSNPATLIYRIFGLILLTAVSIETTRMCLSPVYGTAPTVYHRNWEINLVALVYVSYSELSDKVQTRLLSCIFVLGCAIPAIVSESFRFSSQLGPSWGPTLISLVTSLPLLYLTLLHVLKDNMALARQSPEVWDNLKPSPAVFLLLTAWGTMSVFRRGAAYGLQLVISTFGAEGFSIFGMQVALTCVFSYLAWSKWKQFWIVPLAVALLWPYSIHVPISWQQGRINGVLQPEGYKLLARSESVTGYVSVLENVKDGFRVMRCDHSLLGGEWVNGIPGSKLKEPVYGIFVMLEAVRLVETRSTGKGSVKDGRDKKKALVIGLGVGTSPTALIAHGIKTTSIEIDPVVHAYATRYFNLPRHESIIGDAVPTVKQMRNETYDYIIHDVFTGGVEPLNLFTVDFLNDLKRLMKADGTIAINYAGDLLLPSAAYVVSTILAVFPTCRIYRESAPVGPGAAEDFTNMVLFCRKSAAESFTFRKPTDADLLGTEARKEFLLPRHEIEADSFGINPQEIDDTKLINKETIKTLKSSQEKSRIGHWHVMRGVIPNAVWETW